MNQNPYKILGVSPDADEDTIKKAYRDLARKYHPDRYTDTDLSELAAEKMKEVNAAYEEIMQMRAGGNQSANGARNPGGSSQSKAYSGAFASQFIAVRNCINAGRFDEADRLLKEVPEADRGAEWIFLSGCIAMHRGNYVDAQRAFDTAYRMEPSNTEYWTFKEKMHQRADSFGRGYNTSRNDGGCDLCTTMICADCCCECMGGDLIPCC